MLDLFETMENCRAMRRLKPDPVPDDLIAKILHAGTCAPSGKPSALSTSFWKNMCRLVSVVPRPTARQASTMFCTAG